MMSTIPSTHEGTVGLLAPPPPLVADAPLQPMTGLTLLLVATLDPLCGDLLLFPEPMANVLARD